MNNTVSTRLYVCYLVPDSKEPDYHIIHHIKQFMIEYGNKLKFTRYPINIFIPYMINSLIMSFLI